MAAMHWYSDLESITKEYVEAFGRLTADQLNWKPSPERWSVGQVMDHVIVTNETYFPILAQLRAGTYRPHFNARIGFLATFFGKMILKSVQPETKRKSKTFPVFQPSSSAIAEDIVPRFEAHQSRVIREVTASEELLGRVISSPVNAAVVYRLSTAFDIVVAHERRHFLQAKQVVAEMAQARR